MRSYERNGVTIDQCTGCRGVFLDRGELERLVDAEGSYYEEVQSREPRYEEREERRYEHREHDDDDDREHRGAGHYGQHGRRKHRREGFLGELFDMG